MSAVIDGDDLCRVCGLCCPYPVHVTTVTAIGVHGERARAALVRTGRDASRQLRPGRR